MPDGVYPEELDRLPLLVFEPKAHVKQWRLFVVDPNNFVNKFPENDKDLRVEIKGVGAVSDLDSHLNLRLSSLRNIAQNIEDNPALFSSFAYKIPVKGSFVCDEGFDDNLKLVPGYKLQTPIVLLAGTDHPNQTVVSFGRQFNL